MSRQDIAQAVVEALEEMGCTATIDRSRRHPQIRWMDPVSGTPGLASVPGTTGDRRALLNNVRMVQRLVRIARSVTSS